jgi:hypothetical protein
MAKVVGIGEICIDIEKYECGRFGCYLGPDGNTVEPWEPQQSPGDQSEGRSMERTRDECK